MKNFLKSIFFLLITFLLLLSIQVNAASSLRDRLDNLDGDNTHIQTIVGNGGININTSLPVLIGQIIKLILGIFGVISLIFIIRAGIKWVGSQGDSTKIKEARKIITSGVIGLAIIASSYAITDFVIKQITVISDSGSINTTNCSSFSDQTSCVNSGCLWGYNGLSTMNCYK